MSNWWKRLWQQPKAVEKVDPVFGRIHFQHIRPPGESYWECVAPFAPAGDTLDMSVVADEAGPGADQHEALRRIEARYASLQPAIAAALVKDLDWSTAPRITTANVWQHLRLVGLEVPRRMTDDAEWELTYANSFDENHAHTVYMRGWAPTGDVSMDG